MQATQSRTASRLVGRSNRFAAHRRIYDEKFKLSVADGVGLVHDASNLLGALSLYSELPARPGVPHEEHREIASELRLLVTVQGVRDEIQPRIKMMVRDTGCGMGSVAVPRLMQAGGISPVGRRGIGFRVVRELMAISGRCPSLESQPGVGTSVSTEWECSDGMG